MDVFTIIVDNDKINRYSEKYFEEFPRRKIKPIAKPIPPSLNQFIAMRREQQNSIKQKYKQFAIWLANHYGIANLYWSGAIFKYTFFFPDRRRRDVDNLMLTPKFFNDGFVEAGVLEDDNGERLTILFSPFQYDTRNPRLEIEMERVYICQERHSKK